MTSLIPLKKHIRFSYSDALFSSVMIGAGETVLVPFALVLGFNDALAGLLSSLPFLGGSILQLLAPRLVKRFGSYKRF